MDMVAWRRQRRVLARVTRAAWRLEQAEQERVLSDSRMSVDRDRECQ